MATSTKSAESADDLMRLLHHRLHLEISFRDAMDTASLDAILCPAAPIVAPAHGGTVDMADFWGASLMFNALGWPAGVAPVTRVAETEQVVVGKSRDKAVQAVRDSARGSAVLPVAVQIAAPPWREDVVLSDLRICAGSRGCLCPGSCRGGQRDRPAGVVVTTTTGVSVDCLRIPVLCAHGRICVDLEAGEGPGLGSMRVWRALGRDWGAIAARAPLADRFQGASDGSGARAGDGRRRGAGVPGTRRYRGVKRTPGRESHADYLSRVCSSLPPSGLAKTAVDPSVSDPPDPPPHQPADASPRAVSHHGTPDPRRNPKSPPSRLRPAQSEAPCCRCWPRWRMCARVRPTFRVSRPCECAPHVDGVCDARQDGGRAVGFMALWLVRAFMLGRLRRPTDRQNASPGSRRLINHGARATFLRQIRRAPAPIAQLAELRTFNP